MYVKLICANELILIFRAVSLHVLAHFTAGCRVLVTLRGSDHYNRHHLKLGSEHLEPPCVPNNGGFEFSVCDSFAGWVARLQDLVNLTVTKVF